MIDAKAADQYIEQPTTAIMASLAHYLVRVMRLCMHTFEIVVKMSIDGH